MFKFRPRRQYRILSSATSIIWTRWYSFVSASRYCFICVLILLYVCPHTTMCPLVVSSATSIIWTRWCSFVSASRYYYICVLILLYMCPHTAMCPLVVSSAKSIIWTRWYSFISASRYLILLHMCPDTTIFVSHMDALMQLRQRLKVPHTTTYVSWYYYICVSYGRADAASSAPPGTTIYVSSYIYICALILQYMCFIRTRW